MSPNAWFDRFRQPSSTKYAGESNIPKYAGEAHIGKYDKCYALEPRV